MVEEWIEKVFEVQSLRQNHFSDTRPLDTGKCMVGWGMAGRIQMLRVRES